MLLIIGQTAQDGLFCLHTWHMWDLKREKRSEIPHSRTNLFLSQCQTDNALLSCVLLLDMEMGRQ